MDACDRSTVERGTPSRAVDGRRDRIVALKPELVVEVTYDHASDGRIRHGANIERWRTDRDPRALLAQFAADNRAVALIICVSLKML